MIRMWEIKHEYNKIKERWMMKIAWKMPKWLVYFCAIRLGAHATTGKYGSKIVPELNFMEAIKRWESIDEKAKTDGKEIKANLDPEVC